VEQVEQAVQQELREHLGHLEQHLDYLVLVELEFPLTLQEIIQSTH
jgi:DNA-binding protein Fis